MREYRTPVHIGFHCDAADVVGLLCLSRPERLNMAVGIFVHV